MSNNTDKAADKANEAAKVMAYIKSLPEGSVDESSLDEAVHDMASSLASSANNGGVADQVAFLLEHGWTADELVTSLKP